MSKQNTGRKFFATAATAALVASAIVPVASAAEFTDADKIASWAKESVEALAAKEIITGNPDGSFAPQGNVTRAQAAKMFTVALDLSTEGTENFTDVKDGQWFQGAVVAVVNAGIVNGMSATEFAPNANLTRAQAAKMIVEAYGLEGEADLSKFTDAKTVAGKWSEAYLSTAVAAGVINGKGDKLAANDSISRQEFAVMLTRAIDAADADNSAELVEALTEATTALETAVKALDAEVKIETIADSKAAVAAAKAAITEVEAALEAAKEVITEEEAAKVTAAITAANATVKATEEKIAKVEEAAKAPKVESISAINPVEVKVAFNKAVYKESLTAADFVVTETAATTAVTVNDVQLAEDGKSAILLLATNVPATGVNVEIAEGALLDTFFNKFEKIKVEEVKVAKDTTAPKLLSAVAEGANVVLTFDEPVNFGTSYTGASIDQTTATTQPVNSSKAGKYVYTIAAASVLANGKHTVDLTNVTDFAGNVDVLVSTEVTVTADNSATKVSSVKAEDANSFIVEFSKPVSTLAAANLEIKKGNLTIDATNFNVTTALVDEDGNATTGSSKFVKVNVVETSSNTTNLLYGKDETSVALSVKVFGYTDAAGVLGTEFAGAVTLSKDLTAPAIKSEKLISSTATTIVVPFDKALDSTTANTITVKEGNVLVAQTAAVSGKDLTLTFAADTLKAGKTYTITLAKGAVVSGNKSSEATTISYTVPTDVVTYTTTAPTVASSVVNGKNVLTVTYTGKVNDAAGLATAYKLNGADLPAGSDVYFSNSDKKVVIIELPTSYQVNEENKAAKFTINADTVKYDATVTAEANKFISGSATTSKAYESAITLKDNVAPALDKAEYVKNAAGLATGVKLTFTESIKDSTVDAANFVITQNTTSVSYTVATGVAGTTDLVDDKVLVLTFAQPVAVDATGLTVNTNTDNTKLTLTDAYGNKLGVIAQKLVVNAAN